MSGLPRAHFADPFSPAFRALCGGAAGEVQTESFRRGKVIKEHAGFTGGLGKLLREGALGGNHSELIFRNFKARVKTLAC